MIRAARQQERTAVGWRSAPRRATAGGVHGGRLTGISLAVGGKLANVRADWTRPPPIRADPAIIEDAP